MPSPSTGPADLTRYEISCGALARIGRRLGVSGNKEEDASVHSSGSLGLGKSRRLARHDKLRESIALCALRVSPETVVSAARTTSALVVLASIPCVLASMLLLELQYAVALAFTFVGASVLSAEALASYPARAASRAASGILRDSPETANLMIMSLRHEHSVSRAIEFASKGDGRFKQELRACAWSVIMGKYASFEEALMALGEKWSGFSGDLKASLNAMVTASREATEEGRRRALDRANSALVAGAKRRIEEYALSLSMPSMLIFSLGILLPLMVGSFMPMLSWDVWTISGVSQGAEAVGDSRTSAEMVFVMNVLFPSIAALVAMGAIERHPFAARNRTSARVSRGAYAGLGAALSCGIACALIGEHSLRGHPSSVWMLFSLVLPVALWSLVIGRGPSTGRRQGVSAYEDVLFRTGAGMLEGENFEYSLHKACSDAPGRASSLGRRVSLNDSTALADNYDGDGSSGGFGAMNALQGIWITRQAAAKDELAAGILAMDLAAYLKDLRDIETALRNRLKPTLSMMKTTALLLAPVVLGITYAIFLSLDSITGGSGDSGGGKGFLLVLGIFLAEIDAIVVYFMLGIEGGHDIREKTSTLGAYLIVSETAFVAAATLASA